MIEMVEDNSDVSSRDISKDKDLNPDNLHFITMRNILLRDGFKNTNKKINFFITDDHIHKRLNFTIKRKHRYKIFWRCVCFSD